VDVLYSGKMTKKNSTPKRVGSLATFHPSLYGFDYLLRRSSINTLACS
jgi:hypothetical protein